MKMSGGSYDYLCYKDASDLFDYENQIRSMSDRLAELGYAEDAAKETEELILILRQFQNRVNARLERLQPVWRAVEWWDSGDSSEVGVKRALSEYRGETEDE